MSVAVDQDDHKRWLSREVVRSFKISKRKKNVHIGLQEHYIRDDIPCGSPICNHGCRGPSSLPLYASHYLIPDASMVEHFWEILEFPQIIAVIFVSSVLKEVQTRFNGRQWRRLRSIFTDKRRGNLYFDDEHFIDTTSIQRRDGAHSKPTNVEEVARWFNEHLEMSIPIIILTGHVENTGKPDIDVMDQEFQGTLKITGETDNNVKIMHVSEYITAFWRQDEMILELCSSLVQAQVEWRQSHGDRRHTKGSSANGETLFKNYLSEIAIDEGLQDGSLHVGTFYVSKVAQDGGFVRPSNKGEASNLELWIPTGKFQNRALHGDLVAVRIVPHDEEHAFECERNKLLLREDSAEPSIDGDILEDKEMEDLDLMKESEESTVQKTARLTGEIVGILQRIQRDYSACLEEIEDTSLSFSDRQEHILCIPMDHRIPMVRVKTRQRSFLMGNRFVLRIDGWDCDSKLPKGHVVRILGPIGDLETENRAILVENEINILPFSTLALQELPMDTDENPWRVPQKEYTCRRDLRTSHRTYSIDPPGSKDVDDCLSVRELDDNTIEVGVHIADVSFFIKEGSLLDLEAFSRGTTVYMVGNTYHMLPSILSENLCSLRHGKDRLAVSVIWKVDVQNNFEIFDIWFGRTIIHSRQQMFYAQAQAIHDGKTLPDGWQIHGGIDEMNQIRSDLCLLANFSQTCKSLRESKGALELASAEIRFEIGENEEPLSVESKTQLPMNWIVAEMMIQANSYVARRIYESSGAHALLRRHPPPKQGNFNFLMKCCEAQGLKLDASSNKALASSLDDIQETADPIVQNALKVLATRAMSEAEYIAAGDAFEPYNFSHYGLALEFYAHFTSPIRRYADIVVHRMLISSCERNETHMTSSSHADVSPNVADITQVAGHLNQRHRASKRAQKECNQLHLLMYLEKNAQAEQGVVMEVQPQSLIVFVPKFDLRGRVYLQDKTGKLIIPARDEKMITEGVDVLHDNQHNHALQYLEDTISVIDLDARSVLYEYRKMTSVWVQMRADGSRAHFPTLRLHLLSDDHPAVQKSISENRKITDYTLPVKFRPQMKLPTDQILGENQPKRKKEPQSTTLSSKQLIEATSNESAKLKPTVHDLLEEFELRMHSTSCLFLNNESLDLVNDSPSNKQVKELSSPDVRMTVAILRSYTAINKEQPQMADLRNKWQKKLFQAAVYRSKQTRSSSSNDSVRVCDKRLKEIETRHEAHLLHESMI